MDHCPTYQTVRELVSMPAQMRLLDTNKNIQKSKLYQNKLN